MENTETPKPEKRRFLDRALATIKAYWLDYILLAATAGLIVFLDQWTKSWVRANVPVGADYLPESMAWLEPFARIRHWHNTGTIFGLFKDASMVFTVLAFVVIGLIIFFYPQTPRKEWWLRVVLGIQLGGAIGNLVDRLMFGRVTDFISVGNFAIFNIADASISVGAAILGIVIVYETWREKKQADMARKQETQPETDEKSGE